MNNQLSQLKDNTHSSIVVTSRGSGGCAETSCNFVSVTAVPIPRTTIPDSPSKSKHWWYL